MATKLVPTSVTPNTLIDALVAQSQRRRPRVAQKPDGTLVVCSGRTARKHGWKLDGVANVQGQQVQLGALFSRSQYKVQAAE